MPSLLPQVGKIALWTTIVSVVVIVFASMMAPDASKNNTAVSVVEPSNIKKSDSSNFYGLTKASENTALNIPTPPSNDDTPDPTVLSHLPWQEQRRLREIIALVLKDPTMPTDVVHQEFWGIWGKMNLNDEQYKSIRLLIAGVTADYQKMFWLDAITSIQQGRPFKSVAREQMEKKLLEAEVVSNFRVQQNDELIEKIASNQPIDVGDGQMLITVDLAQFLLTKIDDVITREDRLFTPPVR